MVFCVPMILFLINPLYMYIDHIYQSGHNTHVSNISIACQVVITCI